MIRRIAIFDFDGTLFNSPDRPDDWPHAGFWGRPESLEPPIVPLVPDKRWYIGRTVAAAKIAMSDPETYTCMLTGRTPRFERRIFALLAHAGLFFDDYRFATTGGTLPFKINTIIELADRFPTATVEMWEDRPEHVGPFRDTLASIGRDAVVHLVRRDTPNNDAELTRVAHRYLARRVAEAVAFHGYGMSPESMRMPGPQFTDQKPVPPEDIEAAVDYLEETRPGVLVAYSRGAAVAMVALGEAGVRPRVLWVAPAWRRGWANARPPHVNGTIIHGDRDDAVPLQHSCDLALRTGNPLHVVPDRNHVSILKDKTNPSAGTVVPKSRLRECADTLPDWGTGGRGSPDDVARQVEFTKSL